MHLSFQNIYHVNDREARNGWVSGYCLAKKDQISGISSLKPYIGMEIQLIWSYCKMPTMASGYLAAL